MTQNEENRENPIEEPTRSRLERWTDYFPLALAMIAALFNAWFFKNIAQDVLVRGWDNAYHLSLAYNALQVLKQQPSMFLDFWCDYWNCGAVIFQQYQHLPHVILAFLYGIFTNVPPIKIYNFTIALIYSIFPIVVFVSLMIMDVDPLTAGIASLFSTMVHSIDYFGVDVESVTILGLYSQIYGMLVFPIALAFLYRAVIRKDCLFLAALSGAVLFLCHMPTGVTLFFCGFVFIIANTDWKEVRNRETRMRLARLFLVYFLVGIGMSYLAVSVATNFAYNTVEPDVRLIFSTGYGLKDTFLQFFKGELLDRGRPIILTALCLAGLFSYFSRKPSAVIRLSAVGFMFWFVLFLGDFGPAKVLRIFPILKDYPFSRFLPPLHFFGILLAAATLSQFLRVSNREGKRLSFITRALIFLLAIVPIFATQWGFLKDNLTSIEKIGPGRALANKDFAFCANVASTLPDGRAFIPKNDDIIYHQYLFGIFPYLSGRLALEGTTQTSGKQSLNYYFFRLFNKDRKLDYDLYNIRYIIADKDYKAPDFAREIFNGKVYKIMGVDSPGFFDLVNCKAVIFGNKESFQTPIMYWMQVNEMREKKIFLSSDFKMKKPENFPNVIIPGTPGRIDDSAVVRDGAPRPSPLPYIYASLMRDYPDPGKVEKEERLMNEYRATIDVKNPCYLMLKVTYHPFWQAFIDGKRQGTIMLSPDFLGCKVTNGVHDVVFRYRPPPLRWFLFIFGIVTLIALFFLERKGVFSFIGIDGKMSDLNI